MVQFEPGLIFKMQFFKADNTNWKGIEGEILNMINTL